MELKIDISEKLGADIIDFIHKKGDIAEYVKARDMALIDTKEVREERVLLLKNIELLKKEKELLEMLGLDDKEKFSENTTYDRFIQILLTDETNRTFDYSNQLKRANGIIMLKKMFVEFMKANPYIATHYFNCFDQTRFLHSVEWNRETASKEIDKEELLKTENAVLELNENYDKKLEEKLTKSWFSSFFN